MTKKLKIGYLKILFAATFFVYQPAQSQNSHLMAGVNIPFQYSLGFEYDISPKFSIALNAGLITKPFDSWILDVMNTFGTDPAITKTIGSAFSYGYTLQPTLYWHISNTYYMGLYGQYGYLQANDVPKEALETYYGVSFDQYPIKRRTSTQADITMSSTLYNLGVLVGRKFFFKNSRFHLRTELGFTKIMGSTSEVSSQTTDLTKLSAQVDNEMKDYYWEYGYIPTVNLYLVCKLNK